MVVLVFAAGGASQVRANGRWCISNDVINFGNHQVGTNTTNNVTVTNCGDQPWSFTDVSVHSATGPAFHVNTTCATGMSLAPGQSCTASVAFAPLLTGQTSGALWLRNTTSTPTQLLTFYGRGTDAQTATATLTFSPAVALFPAQEIGRQSTPMTIELHNLGPASLTPSAMVLNGPQVSDFIGYPDTCQVGTPIPAGQSCSLWLYFKPQQNGTRSATLVIDAPQLAALAILPILGIGGPAPPAPGADPGVPDPETIPATGPEGLMLLALALALLGWSTLRRR